MADETGVGYPPETHQRICTQYGFDTAQQDAHDFILRILNNEQDPELEKLIKDRFYYTYTTTTTCADGLLPEEKKDQDMFIPLAEEELAEMEGNVVVLSQGIENYQRDILESGKLTRCEKQGFYKKITLQGGSKLPHFLWIQLKLFGSETGSKLSQYETVMTEENMTILGVDYELLGFITHSGETIKGGHYVCTVKHGITWYKADDESITPLASLPETYEAYLIVYKRKGEPIPPNSMFPTISPKRPESMKNYGNSCFANSALQLLKQTGLDLNRILRKLAPPAVSRSPAPAVSQSPAPAPAPAPARAVSRSPAPAPAPAPAPEAMPIPATRPSKKEIQEMIIFLDRILKWQR
jgi:hypothetical protein